MIIFAKICISIHCANFILRNVHPARNNSKQSVFDNADDQLFYIHSEEKNHGGMAPKV